MTTLLASLLAIALLALVVAGVRHAFTLELPHPEAFA